MSTSTISDLTAASPVEIDTALARLYGEQAALAQRVDWAVEAIHLVAGDRRVGYGRTRRWGQSLDEALAVLHAAQERWKASEARKAIAALEEARAALEANREAQAPLHDEYARRPWTRAFLVTNSGGHVHSSMDCSTCFPTTVFAWLPEYSGRVEDEIVADAGERACTVCYPSAPVEVLSRPTKIFSQGEREAQAAREARAQAKAERERKRLEKALLPDGSPLKIAYTRPSGWVERESLATLVSAKQWLTRQYAWGTSAPQEVIDTVAEAVAAKTGETPAQVVTAAKKRAERQR